MFTPKAEEGMDFKDLKAFNLALLAKQGWQLSQNSGSLAHRVLKARYFPKSNFLEAQLGKKPSYTWRSLMAAREVLWRGLRWSIGNGRRTRIWADRRIPIPNSFKVASSWPQYFEGELVETLLDRESGGWDTGVVKSIFLPHEAKAILSIPISLSFLEDEVIWAWTKKDAVWKETKLLLPRLNHPHREFIDVIWKIWEDRKEIELERLACTAWCIWKNRNAAKFEGKCKQAEVIASEANVLVEEFKEQNVAPRQSTQPRTKVWTPPREGWFKVNVDGAVFKKLGSYGIGIVIRGEKGQIRGAMSKKMKIPLGALEVEAKAFEERVLLVVNLGFHKRRCKSGDRCFGR
ncbi:uncharacterized protein LOC142628818 [Castanea sativa]|uniref:uncharacterized protein LOC142628818 n=1 Tax=Castanea sativa TaxID=21020 RepID=UPI003F64C92D